MTLYLLADGRIVVERKLKPSDEWLERYDSLEEMRFALMTPDGEDHIFRERLREIADDLEYYLAE